MSSIETILSEIISTQREFLSSLKIEEQNLLEGELKFSITFENEYQSVKKTLRSLKLKMKKLLDSDCEKDEVQIASLQQQVESLDIKLKEQSKANRKLRQTPLKLKPQKEELEKKPIKKHLLLEEDIN